MLEYIAHNAREAHMDFTVFRNLEASGSNPLLATNLFTIVPIR